MAELLVQIRQTELVPELVAAVVQNPMSSQRAVSRARQLISSAPDHPAGPQTGPLPLGSLVNQVLALMQTSLTGPTTQPDQANPDMMLPPADAGLESTASAVAIS